MMDAGFCEEGQAKEVLFFSSFPLLTLGYPSPRSTALHFLSLLSLAFYPSFTITIRKWPQSSYGAWGHCKLFSKVRGDALVATAFLSYCETRERVWVAINYYKPVRRYSLTDFTRFEASLVQIH